MELLKNKQQIEEWLKSFNITDFTIKKDFSVDVHRSIRIEKSIVNIPFQFGTIKGNFNLDNNLLNSLKGCPRIVLGDFSVKGNLLNSLKWSPKFVSGNFTISNNQLKDLKYCTQEIGKSLIINSNQITDFKHCPKKVGHSIICIKNPLIDLLDLTTVFTKTFEFFNQNMPSIPYFENFYDDLNVLTLTYEDIKSIQIYTYLQNRMQNKGIKLKSPKI